MRNSPTSRASSNTTDATRERSATVAECGKYFFLPEVLPDHPSESAHRGEALGVRPVLQGLLAELLPPHPREDPHGQEALRVLRPREDLPPGGEPPLTPQDLHPGEAVRTG